MTSAVFVLMNGNMYVRTGKTLIAPLSWINFSRLRCFLKSYHVLETSNDNSKPFCFNQTKNTSTRCLATYNRNVCKIRYNLQAQIQTFSTSLLAFSSGNKFTFENADFASYVKTLEDEFKNAQSSINENNSNNKKEDSKTYNRLAFLEPVVNIAEMLNQKYAELQELLDLIKNEDDSDMKSLAESDVTELRNLIREMEHQIVLVLVGEEVADESDILLEVSAGVGGQEAMLFASEVFNMYVSYARYKNWTVTGLTQHDDSQGGSRKANVQISGNDVYKHLKHETGVHRVQRVPKTEKSGRMHTSTVTVSVLPQPKEIDIEIDPKDLKIETMKGSGPGGQSVNTTDSAVRITHLPSGTVSECREERSQIKNKHKAMEKLKSRMYQEKLTKLENERRANLKVQIGTKGRSEKVRTYNYRDDRISDHRIKGNISNVHSFLSGQESLDELIQDLELSMKYDMLESMLDQHVSTKK